jgi:hypothetical protein
MLGEKGAPRLAKQRWQGQDGTLGENYKTSPRGQQSGLLGTGQGERRRRRGCAVLEREIWLIFWVCKGRNGTEEGMGGLGYGLESTLLPCVKLGRHHPISHPSESSGGINSQAPPSLYLQVD